MATEIVLCGKGGTGKTTIAAFLSKIIAGEGNHVLAVDADSTQSLALFYGIKEGDSLTEHLRDRALYGEGLINLNPDVSDVRDKYSMSVAENLRLLVVGGVKSMGEGCMCPELSLLRALLRELTVKGDDVVVVDMEAGLEPMTRGTIKDVDLLVLVVEPYMGSIKVARDLLNSTKEINSVVVGNKIRNKTDMELLNREFKVFHWLPYSQEILDASKTKNPLIKGEFWNSIEELYGKIKSL